MPGGLPARKLDCHPDSPPFVHLTGPRLEVLRGKIKQAKALFSAFLTDGAYIVFSRRRAKAEADKVDQWTKFSVTDIGQTFWGGEGEGEGQ